MNKKLSSLVLSGLIVLNSTYYLGNVYADNNNQPKELTKNEDTKSTKVVYLQKGEGGMNEGDGSANRPYQNIRTALKNIKDGETLKLVGTVVYTEYDQHVTGGAKPLIINKNITIEGEPGASLYLRAPIQLGADVTFKNIKLEMVPETKLSGIDHDTARSATIYVAGHKLTLDNVNTRVGTNLDQKNDRPYISGGAFEGEQVYIKPGSTRAKSVINIKNPNEETKFSAIYAGDYYEDRDLDVEINIDGKVLDNKIYTGGHNHTLNGDVTVNLGTKSNIHKFDKTNHNGNLDVKLNQGVNNVDFDAKGITNLTLEEKSRILLAKDATFDVDNVVLKNDAAIDFRDMTANNPTVKGNFKGESNVDDSRKGGAILLNNNQTLEIKGELSGTTRLNNRKPEFVHTFLDNHIYVKANLNSKGTLSIEDSIYDNYQLNAVKDSNCINWTTNRIKEGFGDFKWVGEDNRIILSSGNIYGLVEPEIEFTDDAGQEYIPDATDLYYDFEYKLTTLDENGNVKEELYVHGDQDEDTDSDDNALLYFSSDGQAFRVVVAIHNKDNLKNNKMILEVTHIKTQKTLKKNIYVVKDTDILNGNVSISGSPVEGRTISADVSGLPTDIADVKYKWYVKDNSSGQEELVQDQTGKDFVIKPEHVGKSIKVEVEAMNYLGTVYSNDVVVKSKNVAPVIQGIDPIEIKASEVDKFNNGENLKGITAKDSKNNPINNITVTGNVEKPSAGTNEVYKIKYSVVDKDGNTTEEIREVTVTNQKPTILGLTDIVITQGDNYNVKDGVTAEDYEDGAITNIVYPKDDLTKLDAGLHRIKYSVTDSDGNTTEEERIVVVQKKTSSIGPKIQGIDDIELKVSQVDVFNASHQLTDVTVSDDIDSPSEITLSVSGKAEKPLGGNDGVYELTYTAVDSDLNETIEKRKVTVTNRKPTISGLTEITITKGETADITTGVTANDYEDGAIANIVYPTTDLSKLDIGTHKIKYSVTDSDGNTTEEERTVVVKKTSSLNGPEIHGANDITLKVSQVDEFNKNHKLTGVTAVDDIDTKVNISVSGEAKKPLAGTNETYELTYTAIDSDLNETVVKRKVTVTNQKPTISGLTEITITKGETADIRVGVTANDHEDGTITNIVYPTTDLSKLDIGTHKIKYSVTDSDGNTTEEERTVVVNKISSLNGPEIHGANDITLKVSQVDEFNKNHKLTGVTVVDDIDTGLVATVSGDAGKPAPGKNEVYKLTYTVEDKDGNKTELVRNVTVTNQLPTISGLSDIAITEGENIDLKSGITVHDFEDGDITKNLVCLTDLNTLTVGENTVYYSVKDTDGNIVNGERKVVILEKAEQQPDVPVVPETPQQPQQPEKPNTKPEDSIIENLPQIEGIEFEQGNATIESPLSVKVDTIEGLKELLELTNESNFNIDSVEEVKEKEDDNFLIYLLKITKKSVARTEESYFIEVKVAKDNQEVIEHLDSIVDKDNTNNENDTIVEDSTNNENDTIVEDKPNNNTPDKNENSSSNNTSNNNSNNLGDNSNETDTNKEENPKTYDVGVGSYILSGIGSLGLLSIFNKRNRRKK